MRNRSKARLLFVAVVLGYIIVLPPFCFVSGWLSAEPRAQAVARYGNLHVPDSWEYVVVGGGRATEWKHGPAADHPIAVALLIACVVCIMVAIFCLLLKRVHLLDEENDRNTAAMGKDG